MDYGRFWGLQGVLLPVVAGFQVDVCGLWRRMGEGARRSRRKISELARNGKIKCRDLLKIWRRIRKKILSDT